MPNCLVGSSTKSLTVDGKLQKPKKVCHPYARIRAFLHRCVDVDAQQTVKSLRTLDGVRS